MPRLRPAVLPFLVVMLQIGDVARADDPERLAEVALHPLDPDVIVLRYGNGGDGLFYSDDRGSSWRLLCKSAIYAASSAIYALQVAADGHALLGVFDGVWEDGGGGCSWTRPSQLLGAWVSDLTHHPEDPDQLFAITSNNDGTERNAILRRDARGSWSELGSRTSMMLNRLHVAATPNGLRFYESAIREWLVVDGIEMRNYVIRVSDDEGETWREHSFGPTDALFELEGVDPNNPDRLIANLHQPEVPTHALEEDLDRVLVSTDQGESFAEYLTLTEFGGVAFAPDGRVWIGDMGSLRNEKVAQGLWLADDLTQPARPIADYPVLCLAYQDATDTLFACQRIEFGTVDPADGTFMAAFKTQEVAGFVECEGVDLGRSCERQLCRSYCTSAHFPTAPVCAVYEGPYCGPDALPGVAPGAGMAGVGASGASDSDASAAPVAGAAGSPRVPMVDAGGEPSDRARSRSDASGCSCAMLDGRERGHGWLFVSAPALLLWRRASRRGRSSSA